MKRDIIINLSLKELEVMILNHCRAQFENDKLELKYNSDEFLDGLSNGEFIMELYSKVSDGIFEIEDKIELTKNDVLDILDIRLKDLGYGFANDEWIFSKEKNKDIKIGFYVFKYDLQSEKENSKQKSIGGIK